MSAGLWSNQAFALETVVVEAELIEGGNHYDDPCFWQDPADPNRMIACITSKNDERVECFELPSGSFLGHVDFGKQWQLPLPDGFSLSTAFLFEVAICLAVLGSVVSMLNGLGHPERAFSQQPELREDGQD